MRHDVNNFENSVVVQELEIVMKRYELELAMKRALYDLL